MDDSLKFDAKEIMVDLSKNGIGCRPFFYPMHQQPVLINQGLFKGESYPVAEQLSRKGFYLPSGLSLTEDQIVRVSDTLKKTLQIMKK